MTRQTPLDEEILSRFLSSAAKLQAQVENRPEAELDLSREVGGWTIRQIVHHVADDCDVWSMCIKKAIATPGVLVRFEGFPGNEAWADALDFDKRAIDTAIQLINAHRHYLTQLLRHFSHAWDRSVRLANAEGQVLRR